MDTITGQIKGYVTELNFDWFKKMEQYFSEESKGNLTIEYIGDNYETDDNGKLIKIPPTSKNKDFKEYCWSSYYPGRKVKKEWILPYGNWIDGETIMMDYTLSVVISFFGEAPNEYGELDSNIGVQHYRDFYLFLKKLLKIVDDVIAILKASDASTKAIYSVILDSFVNKLKETAYEKYGRIIDAYSFIEGEDILGHIKKDTKTNNADDIVLNVQESISCFRGKWKGLPILLEKDYDIVFAATVSFIKHGIIPSISPKIDFNQATKEFIKKTYHLLYEKFHRDRMEWCQFLSSIFEEFPIYEIKSLYSNFSRYTNNYKTDRDNIEF